MRILQSLVGASFIIGSSAASAAPTPVNGPEEGTALSDVPTGNIGIEATPQQPLNPQIPHEVLVQDFTFAVNYISMIATVFGVILTLITIGFAFTTYIGFREISAIRELEKKLKAMLSETDVAQNELKASISELDKSRGQLEEAIADIRSDINERSRSLILAAHYFNKGEDSYRSGNFDVAVENFTYALDHDEENPDILYRLGRSNVNLGELDVAKNCFERSMTANPEWFMPHMGLATLYRFTDSAQALEHAKAAIERQCDDHEAFDYAGLICRDLDQIDEAIRYHKSALDLRNDANTNFFLALLYFASDRTIEAKTCVFQALAIIENDPDARSIRQVWQELIRWLEAVITGHKTRSKAAWKKVDPFLENERVRSAVLSHVSFILSKKGLKPNDWLGKRYDELEQD